MSEAIDIRPLRLSELPQVIAIERRAFRTPWSLAMFVLELGKPSSICLAAKLDGTIAGYLVCSRFAEVLHVMNVAVDPAHRRRGIGRALMVDLFARADAAQSFTLEVRTSNAAAIRLYETLGFRSAGLRPRYYADTGEDALIMWRNEDQPAESRRR